jgi:succinate-acetate transporter protein
MASDARASADGVRIMLRPVGSGLPLGFLSFAIGMLLLGGAEVGWVATREQPTLGVLIAAFVFPLELVAAIMAFLARDSLATTVLGLFATSWLAQGLIDLTGEPGQRSDAVGLFFVGFAVIIGSTAVIALTAKPLFAAVLALSTARTALSALYELAGGAGLEHAAGVVSLVLAGVATYTGLALLLEDVRPQAVLPIGRRGPAADAVRTGAPPPARDLTAEPGVRDQL